MKVTSILSSSLIILVTRITWVYFMKERSRVFLVFMKFKSLVEKQSGHYIKILWSDRGNEYISNAFKVFCEDKGI